MGPLRRDVDGSVCPRVTCGTEAMAVMKYSVVYLTVMGLAGCVGADETLDLTPEGVIGSALVVENGRELNGRELNGRELNGRELNGRELNGRELNGRELNGRELSDARLGGRPIAVTLQGSELVGTRRDGAVVRGTDLRGVRFTLVGDGSTREVQVDSVIQGVGAEQDVWRYGVSLRIGGGSVPVCGRDASGAAILAIPLAGLWDYRVGVPGGGSHRDGAGALTFACGGGVLAHCVTSGYAPWRTRRVATSGGAREISLADHHQACTRLLRADFCGDGRSFTVEGTVINLYDGAGVQRDTEAWPFEAEWNPDGARCLVNRRITGSATVPRCARDLTDARCGDPMHFATGTLIMSEFEPRHGHR